MSNDLPTVIELLVLGADEAAPWLLSGDQPLVSDHDISTFMPDHLAWHAERLKRG